MIKKFRNIKVSGMSLVLPQNEISIFDELQYYGNSEKKAERAHRMAGFWKRRVADQDVTAADLGTQAAENLIASMQLDKSKIEVTRANMEGSITYFDENGHSTVPLRDYTEDLHAKHLWRETAKGFTFKSVNDLYKRIVNSYAKSNLQPVSKALPIRVKQLQK